MTISSVSGIIQASPDGWLKCPICGYSRLKKVQPDESAELVFIHCRRCKNEIPLTLKQGQSFQSQSQRHANA